MVNQSCAPRVITITELFLSFHAHHVGPNTANNTPGNSRNKITEFTHGSSSQSRTHAQSPQPQIRISPTNQPKQHPGNGQNENAEFCTMDTQKIPAGKISLNTLSSEGELGTIPYQERAPTTVP
jgi:hypothetical protein